MCLLQPELYGKYFIHYSLRRGKGEIMEAIWQVKKYINICEAFFHRIYYSIVMFTVLWIE